MVLLLRQIWTLVIKNLLIALVRHPLSTPFRAFLLPCIFIGFLSYARYLFIPPSTFGIGHAAPIFTLPHALDLATGGRNKLVLVNNGFTGGDIESVINSVTSSVTSPGIDVQVLQQEEELLTQCRNSILGTSRCIGAAVFFSSPTEGNGGIWNYSLRADGALGTKINVDSDQNDAQVYVLPLQHAVDTAIAQRNGTVGGGAASNTEAYAYTSKTPEQRQKDIRTRYMGGIIDILAVAFFLGMVGVSYQLTGLVAMEREIGMAQLLDSMMPNVARWQPQAARIISNHFALDLIYLPGWIVMSIILSVGVFSNTSAGIMIIFNLLAGLAVSSFSMFGAGFFKKAQLSGILTVISFILLAVVAQVTGKAGTASVAVLSLLFPPMNYVHFIIFMARWERKNMATNLVKSAPENPSTLPGIVLWVFLIIQIIVYPVLGAFIERLLYGTTSPSRKTQVSDSNVAISVTGFTKIYQPRWMQRLLSFFTRRPLKTVLAVSDLNLQAYKGEIMVYLGANGSGKSTTLDAIAGLTEITAGEITINFPGERSSLGLCPQKNVLWDHLTVLEHVRIFNKLKSIGKTSSKTELETLITSCDISTKVSALSKTLSGGQKRKLQLAMMFTGGSAVCCVDEVSSGLDPLSRRKIWDILLAERGRRSIIFTTHFLDEADLLADHIAVLSKGSLKAYGTSVELKHKLGSGYRVHVYHVQGTAKKPAIYKDISHSEHDDQTIYLLPSSAQASEFLTRLEADGTKEYAVSGPTIEDVFLKLADEVRSDDTPSSPKPASDRDSKRSASPDSPTDKAAGTDLQDLNQKPNAVPELLTGRRIGMAQQARVLFWKRFIVVRRNTLPSLAALLIPIVAAGLVTLFLKGYELAGCTPFAGVSISDIASLSSQIKYQLVAGPTSALTPDVLRRFAATLPGGSGSVSANTSSLLQSLTLVNTLDEFNTAISSRFANITPGGFFAGDPPTFAFKGNGDVSYPQIIQNMLDNLISNVSIASRYQAFDVPWPADVGKPLQLITYAGLAFAVYPSFFALYPTIERVRNVRGLHYSNGVRALPLWLAYTAFDFVIVLIVSVVAIGILAGVSDVWYHIGYLFVVFFLYGLASILLSYVVSLFSRSQLAAFAFAATGQAVVFLGYFIAYMSVLTYVEPANQTWAVNVCHFTIGIIAPVANLTRAFFVSLNVFSITCRERALASDPGSLTLYGGPILYLILQSLFLFGLLLWWDTGSMYQRFRAKKQIPEVESNDTTEAEISNELTRVSSSKDGLRVLRLTKQFKKNIAVDDVTFGVPRGEVFALLGPNGAGKSTCISLIRGDLQPSRRGGDILVEDTSVIKHRALARSRLGVCPQFDAMDTMTVAEHLHFYARIRGVSDPSHNAQAVMQAVGLEQYADRMAANLSGGNKRKLSLGIALMGNPSVLLLDEPSSGMDAASKRVMWRTLASVVPGRSLVLTTHSMEEADALANRAGIMASKMLALGTTDYLRRRHGDSYYIHLVHSSAPHTSDEDMEHIRTWARKRFPNAEIEQNTYHGQLRFSVPTGQAQGRITSEKSGIIDAEQISSNEINPDPSTISDLFSSLESEKHNLGIEYYSVSRATLDQVFLNIVGKHNVEEEGTQHVQGEKQPGQARKGLKFPGWAGTFCCT